MRILLLHLSDIHIATRKDTYDINVDKMIQALNTLGNIDDCAIIISGDIAKNGYENEYKAAGGFIGHLINEIKVKKSINKFINVITVPGNHDLDLTSLDRKFETIWQAFKAYNLGKTDELDKLVEKDINALDKFFEFANYNGCFRDDKIVSSKYLRLCGLDINFTLINTAMFSLLGSANQDMGIHFLYEENLSQIKPHRAGDLNIAVMHHSFEWFATSVKEKMRDLISNNFSLVFEGHEHDGFSENRSINQRRPVRFIQGCSLSGDLNHQKGFTTVVYDTDKKTVKGTIFNWEHDIYKPTELFKETKIERNHSEFTNTEEFINYLKNDDNQKLISQYFVFPSLMYSIVGDDDEIIERKVIDDCYKFIETILENKRTVITGDNKSGKSTIAKHLYQELLDNQRGIVPLLLTSDDLNHKKIDKFVEYAFNNQYENTKREYDKYYQLEKEERILIIDDIGKIEKKQLEKMIEHYDEFFCSIVLVGEEKVDINIRKQVIDTLTDKKIGQIYIKPFLYNKRKTLITKVYDMNHLPEDIEQRKKVVDEINNLINTQIKFFRLDPEFIVNFVSQYTDTLRVSLVPGSNIFSMVYENSIKSKIINNAQQEDVNGIFHVLEEIAFFMHFEKESWITIAELTDIVKKYNDEYRGKVNVLNLLNVGKASRLLSVNDNMVRLKDNNLLAYFVAQALNKKYHYGEVSDNLEYILNNLCFGINSDIVLFMALITSNPNIINTILQCAHKHFEGIEELSFDKCNVPFLCNSDFKVKTSIPDQKEKREKEKQLEKYEEDIKVSELIELVDEYGYNEADLGKIENQIMKSIKFLEILSKILPAFSHNMRTPQQDELVKTLYEYPNRFIYQLLIDLSENYEQAINDMYTKISEIRKEKNIAELNLETVKKMMENMSISIVISLYQLVASTATNTQTIEALEAFDYRKNTNYQIMNLMMAEKIDDIKKFDKKVVELDNSTDIKLLKSMIKFTVRNFYLNHEVKMVGTGQSLLDRYFGSSEENNEDKKMIKNTNIKNRFIR